MDVKFYSCQLDQVRLIQMGYIRTSPKFPRTDFSICLLQFHHIIWKHCAVSITLFSKEIDEFLDSNNPLVLLSQTGLNPDQSYTVSGFYQTIFHYLNMVTFWILHKFPDTILEENLVCFCGCILGDAKAWTGCFRRALEGETNR